MLLEELSRSKKNADAPQRQKAPKIQRFVTDARLRRKKLIKKNIVDVWQKIQTSMSELSYSLS
jgi:hypothetical protein